MVTLETKSKQKDTDSKALLLMTQELNRINEKLEKIVEVNTKLLKINEALLQKTGKQDTTIEFSREPDAMAILNLPLALRKTIMILYKLREGNSR